MRFIVLILFLAAFFMGPALTASACEMHQKTEKNTKAVHPTSHTVKAVTHQADCCSQSPAAHQQKGHCTHDNCTDNSCHPVSIYSLHTVNLLEISSLPAAVADHRIGRNPLHLPSYAYTIWQPPRLG
ncbi:hypothetical protein LQ567_22680 [Niabella pedocola]|uniref:CopL family metal-binding regulatory protein n=1 Tax=Niabella pedocola TaxID=1752077 RepID=A0ABS8PX10_9BACT|nr:hypothetical protein [Niabella pedocola]MCD2425607.1 hypothetical protein [Niabella pedocola]